LSHRAKTLWLVVGTLFVVGLAFRARRYVQTCDSSQPPCASLQFALAAFWDTLKFFDDHNGVMTAIATAVVAWFTFSLRQSTDKLWDAGNQQRLSAEKIAAAQSADMQASVKAANNSAQAAITSNQIAVDNANNNCGLMSRCKRSARFFTANPTESDRRVWERCTPIVLQ
jgi:hypothetical protein